MKTRFFIYQSWEESFKLLSVEEQATMLMNFFKYHRGEKPILNTPGLKFVWAGINFLLEKDNESYKQAAKRGKNATEKRLEKQAKLKELEKQMAELQSTITSPYNTTTEPHNIIAEPQQDCYVNVNDNVNNNVNDNVNEDGNENVEVNEMFIVSQFHKGMTTSSLIELYPEHKGLINSVYLDFEP